MFNKDDLPKCEHGIDFRDQCSLCELEDRAKMPGTRSDTTEILPDQTYPLEPNTDAGCYIVQLDGGRYGCNKCNESWMAYPSICPAMKAGADFVTTTLPRYARQPKPDADKIYGGAFKPHYEKHGDKGKPSFNPKDSVGVKKVPLSAVPMAVMLETGLAMMEGARKYGRHNYRVIPVMASTYFDAVMARHLPAWWEGEDIDEDSGLSHITKAIASLVVLRDAMIQGTFLDDRPPHSPPGFVAALNKKAAALIEKYPDGVPAFTEKSHGDEARDAEQRVLGTQGNTNPI